MNRIKQFLNEYEIPQFIVCILVSSPFIIGVLGLIFLISPNSAHMFLEASSASELNQIEAENISGLLATRAFTLQDFEELYFWPEHQEEYIIKGEKYSGNDVFQIKIVPWTYTKYVDDDGTVNIPKSSATFYMKEEETAFLYFTSKYVDSENPKITIPYMNHNFEINFYESFGSFYSNESGSILPDHDGGFLDYATGEFVSTPTPCERITFTNCRAYIVLYDGTEIDCGEIWNSDTFYISPSEGIHAERITLTLPYGGWEYTLSNIEVENVTHFETVMSGNMLFSYARTPSEYQLRNQRFWVGNDNNKLDINISLFDNIESTDNVFSANGNIIEDAILSENNLFPDLKTWFRENVYLAPLTLITTVFGALSLNAKRKRPSNEDALKEELLVNLNKFLLQNIDDKSDRTS